MTRIQELLIRWLFAPLACLVGRVGEQKRQRGMTLCGLGLFLISFLYGSGYVENVRYLVFFAAGCLCLGLMVLFSLKTDLQPVKFHGPLLTIWLLIGVLILVSGIRFNTEYLSEAILFLLLAPVFFLVWGNLNYKYFLSQLTRICRLSFIVYLALTVLFFPASGRRMTSVIRNPNGTAEYLALVLICLLIEILNRQKLCRKLVRDVILMGIGSALLLYTGSRTGLLAVLVASAGALGVHLYFHADHIRQRLLVAVLPMVLSFLLFLPTTVYLLRAAAVIPRTIQAVSQLLLPDSDGVTTPGLDFFEFTDYLDNMSQRLDAEGKDAGELSSGRVDIWLTWLRNLKLFGNGAPECFFIGSRGQFYENAHMTVLTIAYRSGIVCGILYLLFNILAGIRSIGFAIRRKGEAYGLMPLAVSLMFGVVSVLESLNTPFTLMLPMYYYFIQTPLMVSDMKKTVLEDSSKQS